MTVARRSGVYRSGHCTGGAVGGHERCHETCSGVHCACWCHQPAAYAASTDGYVDDRGRRWYRVEGLGWRRATTRNEE